MKNCPMEVNFLFWKIFNQVSLEQYLNFSFEKIDSVRGGLGVQETWSEFYMDVNT